MIPTICARTLLGLLLLSGPASAQIVVTATGGNPGPTNYTTLRAAFDALNAGTHTNIVSISVQGDTTETAPAVLDATATNYFVQTLSITPSGGSWTISGNISGAVIHLRGASFVTIDGRINGSGRNLTVSNTRNGSATAAIWLGSVPLGLGVRSASSNIIRNLEISCGGTELQTFGIFLGGGEGIISGSNGGDGNTFNEFRFNRIIRARNALYVRGISTNPSFQTTITDNIIGPSAFGPDQIGKTGIFCALCTNTLISRNTVQFVGGTLATTSGVTDRAGIAIGAENWAVSNGGGTSTAGANYTITQNNIHDIVDERGSSAVGLLVSANATTNATNNLVANNFIYNIRANATGDNQACGLGISGGINDRFVYNTIHLVGDQDPPGVAATTTFGNAIRIALTSTPTHGNLTLANNSVSVDANSDTAGVHFYAVTTNFLFSFGSGFSNYNNLYINTANPQVRTGGQNSTGTGNTATTEYAGLAQWRTVFTPNQDLGTLQINPLHVSPTDLHLQANSPNIGEAIAISGVTTDFDGQDRVGAADIGADEYGIPPTFTNANATVFTAGVSGSFNATATGTPAPTFSLDSGALPGGVTLGASGLLSGVPDIATGGSTYPINIRAANGFAPDVIQPFTLRVNRRPAGGTAVLTALQNVSGAITLTELRAVSSDPDSDPLTISSVSPTSAQGGTVVLGPSAVTYAPPPGYSGPDSFSFVVTDGYAGSTGAGTVNVTVSASAASLNLLSFSVGAGGATVAAQGIQGVTYMVQRSPDLLSGWTNLSGPISPGANGRIDFIDSAPLPPRYFYRVVVP